MNVSVLADPKLYIAGGLQRSGIRLSIRPAAFDGAGIVGRGSRYFLRMKGCERIKGH